MFVLFGVLVAAAGSMVRGGRFRHLSSARLAMAWLVPFVVGFELVSSRSGPGGPAAGDSTTLLLLLLGQACVSALVLANVLLRGMPLVALGTASNAVAIVANRGMPVAASAISALTGGATTVTFTGTHHLASPATRVPLLVDRLPIPLLDVVVSIGDVLVVVGLAVVVDRLLRPAPLGGRTVRGPGPTTTL